MKVLLIDNDTKHIDSFKPYISTDSDVISKNAIDLQSLNSYNAVILSGSQTHPVIIHAKVYKNIYTDEMEVIKKSTSPVLGICVGMELMVHTFGGTLKKMSQKIQEIHRVEFIKDPIFEGISELIVYKGHRWVIDTLPPDFIPLAYSATGIEVIKHKERLLYGVQFHPEAHSDSTNGYKVLQNFLRIAETNMQH